MSQPKPKSSLDNSCAVISDNTLYVYTPDAFQSLKLEEGAKWKELSSGESVQGAACVGSPSGFWVVGGAGGSTGLQKFTYDTGEWSNISPQDPATQNRQYHSSIYIPANDEILVFAGTKDGSQTGNMETFSIQASEPYGVSGFDTTAPNAIRPFLLRWSDADALMVGGGAANTKVYLFNPNAKWRDYGASLAEPIAKDASQVQAALLQGDDGSQNLFLFDMTESPNKVSRIVIQDASGTPVVNSPTLTERSLQARQDGGGFPSYNSTLAPTETRQNFGIAQGPDGMVVFTGGNAKDPLAFFDSKNNSWVDPADLLVEKKLKVQSVSSSSASSTSTRSFSTSTSSATTTASISSTSTTTTDASTTTEPTSTATEAAAGASESGNDDDGLNSNTILGITLGSIFAFLIILAALLFLLRRRKQKSNRAAAAQAGSDQNSGMPTDEKDHHAFAAVPRAGPPNSPGQFRGHHPQGSQDSYSSMAILMGRMNQQKGMQRKASNDTDRTSTSSHHRQFKSTISKPIPQDDTHPILRDTDDRAVAFDPAVVEPRPRNGPPPDPDDGTRRSSGWNKYWSGGSSLQLLGFGGGAKRNTVASEQSSHYSQTSHQNPRVTQDSATVPPLNFEGRTAMNRVNSGSPVVTGYGNKLPFGEGMAGKIERPSSKASSGYSSGIPESVNEAWDPTDGNKPWGADRAPSSVYNSGFNFGTQAASSGTKPQLPSGVSTQPQLAMASQSSDMSWLNLGDQSRNGQSQF